MPQLDLVVYYYSVPTILILYFIMTVMCVFYGIRSVFFDNTTIFAYIYRILFKLRLTFNSFALQVSKPSFKYKLRDEETVWIKPSFTREEIWFKDSNFTWLKYVPRKPRDWKPRAWKPKAV